MTYSSKTPCPDRVLPSTLHTSHCTLHSSHSKLQTSHSTLHTPHFSLLTASFTLQTSHFTLHTSHCTLHTSQSTLHTSHFTVHTSHFTVHTSHFALHSPHFTLHTSQSTLLTSHFTLHTSHSTFHTSHFWLLPSQSKLHTSHFALHTPHFTLVTSHCFLHTPALNFTLHTSHFSLPTASFTLHTSHCTLHAPHFTALNLHATASENCSCKTGSRRQSEKKPILKHFLKGFLEGKSLAPKWRKSADKSLSQPSCSHSNAIYEIQLQKTIVLRMQPKQEATLQSHLHCGKDPTVANHNGIPSTTHPAAPLAIPFTLRERSYSCKSQWNSVDHTCTKNSWNPIHNVEPIRDRSEHDPRMIRPHTRPSRNRRTAEVDHRRSGTDFVWKNMGFCASAISQKRISCET